MRMGKHNAKAKHKYKPSTPAVSDADSPARGEPVDETERLAFEFQVPIPLYFGILVRKLILKYPLGT